MKIKFDYVEVHLIFRTKTGRHKPSVKTLKNVYVCQYKTNSKSVKNIKRAVRLKIINNSDKILRNKNRVNYSRR